jgi:hypothetical protein
MRTMLLTVAEDTEMFLQMYIAFSRSGKMPGTLEEMDVALRVLRKLHALSTEGTQERELPSGETKSVTVRILTADGVLMLEEEEYQYLKTTLYPPQCRWTHQGLLIFAAIRERVESAVEGTPAASAAAQNGRAIAAVVPCV